MNKIVFRLYVSTAAKPFKKVMSRAYFCLSVDHQRTDPLGLCHPIKPSLPLMYIALNVRANPAESHQLTGCSPYNPHRGPWWLSWSDRRSRKAVSFIEFNP